MSRLIRTRGILGQALTFALLVGGMLLTACSHYRLGTGTTPVFKTLYVAPIENSAGIPEAVGLYSVAVREAFLKDGRVQLVNSPDSADATLKVTLSRYRRVATSARSDDTGLARKFDLEVALTATLHDNRANKDLFADRSLTAVRQIFNTPTPNAVVSVQQQAEYNAQPLLAENAANQLCHAVLDTW